MRAVILLLVAGCASTQYAPQLLARGELVLTNRGGLELHAGGRRVAGSLRWKGLAHYVRCDPRAHEHAVAAEKAGSASLAFSILGGSLGTLALGGLAGFADDKHLWQWLAGGIGAGVLGAIFASTSRLFRNRANGHALDAMNQYNDSVGSLGATCNDLRYPPAVGPSN